MNILGICGSTRSKGNTYDAIAYLMGLVGDDTADTAIVELHDKKVADCDGCGYCREHKTCIIDDDAHAIYDRAKAADIIIVGSSVYGGSLTGILKTLMDRFSWWSSTDDRAFEGQIGIPIVTGRRAGHNAVHAEIMMWMHIRGFIMVGSTYWNICLCGTERGTMSQDEEFLRHCRHLAANVQRLYAKIAPTE